MPLTVDKAAIPGRSFRPAALSSSVATGANTGCVTFAIATKAIRASAPRLAALQNRESKTGPGDRSRYQRRTSAFREWRRIQDRENGAERRGLCQQQEFGAGDETGWLWKQSPTNWSPRLNSLIYGNLQGIFYSLQGIGPETHQKRLPDPAVTMKFPTQRNREFLRA